MANPQNGGALLKNGDYSLTGAWTFGGAVTFNGAVTGGTGGTVLASPTITGTVAGGAAYAMGASTGTSLVLSGDCKAATFHAGSTAGVTAGPFTTVASIQTIAGIVTALTGS